MRTRSQFFCTLGMSLLFALIQSCDSAPAPAQECGANSASEPVNATGGCTPVSMDVNGTLLGPYGTAKLCLGNREYMLQINEWNSTDKQVLDFGNGYFYKMTTQQASVATNGGPTGYPSMFIGDNGGRHTAGSGMPKLVSALTTVPTTWVWADNGATDSDTNIYNATYDVWFSTSAAGDPTSYSPSGGFLMVWLHKPSAAQPIGGSPKYTAVTIDGIPGTWDVWIGPNGSVPVVSYVRTDINPAYSMSFDLNAFIRDAVTHRPGTITDSMYLTNIFAGFEIWSGGVGLQTTAFCAAVN